MRTVHIHAPLGCASSASSFAVRPTSGEGIGNGGSVIALELRDLPHPGAGVNGHDMARPAEFLLDSSGIVRWVNLTKISPSGRRPKKCGKRRRHCIETLNRRTF